MSETTVIGLILLAGGLMCLGASILNWMWFYRNWRVRALDKFLGRTATRIIYFIIGIAFTFFGIVNIFS